MRFLFVDRILALSPRQMVRGIKHVTQDDSYLCYDEQGQLCFIPSLIGEMLGQLAAWNVMVSCDFTHRPVAGVVSSACLHRNAYVGETLLLESFIDSLDDTAVQYHSVARIHDEIVFTIEGALGPMLPMNEFIDAQLIRQQFAEINRPGEWFDITCSGESERLPLTVNKPLIAMTFDYVTANEPGVSLSAIKRISRAAPYFPDHFPNKPVLPLTVLLECKLNLAREFIKRAGFENSYQVREIRRIKMSDFVFPGDEVFTTVRLKSHQADELVLQYRSEVNDKRICVLEVVLN